MLLSVFSPQLFKNAVPRNPSSDIIRPDSGASITIIPSLRKSVEDFLGPLSDSDGEEGRGRGRGRGRFKP